MKQLEISIPLCKAKLSAHFLGALFFVALATSVDTETSFYGYGLSLVTIFFFGSAALFSIKKLFDSAPGLTIDDNGIFDNTSGISYGLIPWSDITGISSRRYKFQKLLVISVRNVNSYAAKGNVLQRLLNKGNVLKCGSPIVISSNALDVSFYELERLLLEKFNTHGIDS